MKSPFFLPSGILEVQKESGWMKCRKLCELIGPSQQLKLSLELGLGLVLV